jgi:exodeoxyribonuclease VII large subunit
VIAAVGHETDVTIADFVADLRAATPSEAARLAVPETVMLRKNMMEWKQQLHQRMEGYFEILSLKLRQHDIEGLRQRLNDRISYLELECKHQAAELEAYNPYSIMDRGYAAVVDKEGRFAKGVDTFKAGDSLTVIFKDGKINCSVEEVRRRSNGKEN